MDIKEKSNNFAKLRESSHTLYRIRAHYDRPLHEMYNARRERRISAVSEEPTIVPPPPPRLSGPFSERGTSRFGIGLRPSFITFVTCFLLSALFLYLQPGSAYWPVPAAADGRTNFCRGEAGSGGGKWSGRVPRPISGYRRTDVSRDLRRSVN